MNCANHPEVASAAFCRTCGKPLCATCTRDVRGVIYCENCLAARLEGVQPPQAPYQPAVETGMRVAAASVSGPNAGLAGVLAGFFPFGVGAVYCGQYAKGLAHLLIFSGLIWGVSTASDNIAPVLGIGIGFFYLYQIVDAVRSARAIQMGQPAPDPFGLGKTFGAGEKVDTSKIPVGAIVLIGLGFLFLMQNMGIWFLSFHRLWPLLLVVMGGWLFAKRWGLLGQVSEYDCDRCRARGMVGPALMVTLGILFLFEQTDIISFHRTWPLLLVVIGLVKVLQGNASTVGHIEGVPAAPAAAPSSAVSGEVQPPSNEVRNG